MGDIGKVLTTAGQGLFQIAGAAQNAEQMKMQAEEHSNRLELLKQQRDELEFNKATSRIEMGLKLGSPKLIEDYFNGVGKPHIEKVFGPVPPEFIKLISSKPGSEKARLVGETLRKNPGDAKEFMDSFVASGATNDPALAYDVWNNYLEIKQKEATLAKTRSEAGTGGEFGKRAFSTAQAQIQDIDSAVAKVASENPGTDRRKILFRELANRGMTPSEYAKKKSLAETGSLEAPPAAILMAPQTEKGQEEEIFNPNSFKEETELRKEFQSSNLYKNFSEQATGFDKVKDGFENPSAVGDIGMIYGYMKLIDPSSSVKEGEVALAEQAKGIPAQVLGLYNKAVKGQRLPNEVRQDFYNKALSQVEKAKQRYSKFSSQYTKIAEGRGLNANNVVVPIFEDKVDNAQIGSNASVFDDIVPKQ